MKQKIFSRHLKRRHIIQGGGALLAGAALPGCIGSALQAHTMPAAGESLDAIARQSGFRFGTAINASHLDDSNLVALVKRECSVLVAENAFKWKHIEPRPGKYRWEKGRAITALAESNNMYLRGHTMAWNQDNRVPKWLLQGEKRLGSGVGSKMMALMQAHILTMLEQFPEVDSWDVVNEAIQLQDGTLRDSVLTRAIGPEFVDIAFGTASEAAPDKQMVYNDYMSWGKKPDHRNGVLRFLESALKRGVRIDALGIQSHLGPTLGQPLDEKAWHSFLTEVQGMGLDVLITELDCADRYVEAKDIATRDAETAAFTKGYLDLTLSFENVKQIVLWGISDRDTYLNSPRRPKARNREDGLPQRGHVYDDNLVAKPMRDAIIAAMKAAPKRENKTL